MKRIFGFLGSRLVGGFLILLPVLLTYLLLGQMFDGLLVLTTPVADVIPETLFTDIWIHRFVAAAVLVVCCLLAGLAMGTMIGKSLGDWVENRVLLGFPPYRVIRNLSRSLSEREGPSRLRPALILEADDKRTPAFIVEEHASGDFTLFVPLAPTATVGTLYVVGPSRVQLLDASMKEVIGAVMNWGSGIEAVLDDLPPAPAEVRVQPPASTND